MYFVLEGFALRMAYSVVGLEHARIKGVKLKAIRPIGWSCPGCELQAQEQPGKARRGSPRPKRGAPETGTAVEVVVSGTAEVVISPNTFIRKHIIPNSCHGSLFRSNNRTSNFSRSRQTQQQHHFQQQQRQPQLQQPQQQPQQHSGGRRNQPCEKCMLQPGIPLST